MDYFDIKFRQMMDVIIDSNGAESGIENHHICMEIISAGYGLELFEKLTLVSGITSWLLEMLITWGYFDNIGEPDEY